MRNLSETLYALSTGRRALLGLIVFLLFTALVLPAQAEKAAAYTVHGSPDGAFWYTPAELKRMAADYGAEGRQAYANARWQFDILWPLVYAFFLTTALSFVYAKGGLCGNARLLNLVPLTGMLLDFAENLSTSWVMLRYPAPAPLAAALAPVFTLLKWLFVNGSFLLLLAGVLWLAIRALKNKNRVQ